MPHSPRSSGSNRLRGIIILLLATAVLGHAQIEGGVIDGNTIYAWGAALESFLPGTGSRVRLGRETGFGPGGCLASVSGGRRALVLHQRANGRMVWLAAPDYAAHVIDDGADFRDCLAIKLHGRRGVLVTHRQMQVRFYEIPPDPLQRWPYREIYSIYTPSAQGGLLAADIDGDGRRDILHGNYWIQSPDTFELSWRLFAIHNWWEGPRSALVRLAMDGARLIAAESEAGQARLAWFEKPADPKQFWREHPLSVSPALRRPRALVAMHDGFAVGEDAGSGSRVLRFRRPDYRAEVAGRNNGARELFVHNGGLIVLTADGIQRLK